MSGDDNQSPTGNGKEKVAEPGQEPGSQGEGEKVQNPPEKDVPTQENQAKESSDENGQTKESSDENGQTKNTSNENQAKGQNDEDPEDEPTIAAPETQPTSSANGNSSPSLDKEVKSSPPLENNTKDDTRSPRQTSRRTPSIALSVSSTSSGQQTVSSMVFVKNALDAIAASKDAKKISALDTSVKKALKQLKDNQIPQPAAVFQPLQIVCSQSTNNDLISTALDCLSKLFSFSFLEESDQQIATPVDVSSGVTPPPAVPLIDRAVNTVCDSYKKEGTDHNVEMQIVKALSAAVLNEELVIHEKTLLKAIRQVYAIFVNSTSNNNQIVAQASLTQMVNVVFERIKKTVASSSSSTTATTKQAHNSPAEVTPAQTPNPSEEKKETELTLQEMETRAEQRNVDDEGEISNDIYVKDAFLVFRTLCKISSNKRGDDDDNDTKSHYMRSKLLALHLIHTILKAHMTVFLATDIIIRSKNMGDETFVEAVRDYIGLAIARNATSISPPVFEISAEIFWLILSNLRPVFKKHLEAFFTVYFDILEMPTSPHHLKQFFLTIVQKICNDPRALVELFLNYDCDNSSSVNAYERIIDILTRTARSQVHVTQMQVQHYNENKHKPIAVYNLSLPPALSIASVTTNSHAPDQPLFPVQYALKMIALDSLVAVLRSLLTWSHRTPASVSAATTSKDDGSIANSIPANNQSEGSLNGENSSSNSNSGGSSTPVLSAASSTTVSGTAPDTPLMSDDPNEFARLKQRKSELHDAIAEFNFKPKRGLDQLIRTGFIENREPETVASFMFNHSDLDKAALGEFLGEGDEYSISVMHAFVDFMDFTNSGFVEAIRKFLQKFRLPGEAQKIDRLMLKFAARYYAHNPGTFKDADAAYVLSYSVVLLNTDLHSSKVKATNRMTPEDFIKNNRGINDGGDLPRDFLLKIYDEILNDEIKLQSEQHAAMMSSDGRQQQQQGQQGLGLLMRRDYQKEAYLQVTREMTSRTEKLFQSMGSRKHSAEQDGRFYVASHVNHVKPMFQVAWMSFLAGLSDPLRESDEPEIVKLCLDGFKFSIRLACWFPAGSQSNDDSKDMARTSFINALEKFTNLQNPSEIKMKNVEGIKLLLEIALTEGNMLFDSWKNILTCISQLQRLQLINSGIDSNTIPDVSAARITRTSTESTRSSKSFAINRSKAHSISGNPPFYSPDVRNALKAEDLSIAMDRVFEQTYKLDGDAVVYFVNALSEVSMEEIQSSGNNQHPRTDALSKMVDVCYYNMKRIRVEWSRLWQTMGEQFNKVCCHSNSRVVQFALNALRQLSLNFLTLEELPHFKFQRDFLQPFEYVMRNNDDLNAKDMVLDCLDQMILTHSDNIRSGWGRMFQVFSAASSANSKILQHTFKIVKRIYDKNLSQVLSQDAFADMVGCLSEIAKNPKDQKSALHCIELLKTTISEVLNNEKEPERRKSMWYAILQAFQSVIIESRDLEVRSRALNYLFDSLTEYGGTFDVDTWDSICQKLLFPIFDSLGKQPLDEETVWLNTTMVQALRNMIALLTHYFDTLERMLNGFLDLLVRCIDQENDTVSKIGSSCLAQLIMQNVDKFRSHHWSQIVDKIELLFESTTAREIFAIAPADNGPGAANASSPKHDRSGSIASVSLDASSTTPSSPEVVNGETISYEERQKKFRPTIIKSILQRLMISTVNDLISTNEVFIAMPTKQLLRIAKLLRSSYQFSRDFNNDRALRMRIWKQHYMADMPNLLTQESISALTYVNLMMHLYRDSNLNKQELDMVEQELIPQCVQILQDYNSVDSTQKRYISTLWPVILAILTEYLEFNDDQMRHTIKRFYPHVVELLSKDIVPEVRDKVRLLLLRVGDLTL